MRTIKNGLTNKASSDFEFQITCTHCNSDLGVYRSDKIDTKREKIDKDSFYQGYVICPVCNSKYKFKYFYNLG